MWVAWQDNAAWAMGQRRVLRAPARQRQRMHCQCRRLGRQLQNSLSQQSAQTVPRKPKQQAPQPTPALPEALH